MTAAAIANAATIASFQVDFISDSSLMGV
jgi:hypothetical protein